MLTWSYGWAVPVEFLSDQEAAAFGRYGDSVSQADLEQFFYLDDANLKLVAGLRGDHNRLGFSVQLATARFVGRFLADPRPARKWWWPATPRACPASGGRGRGGTPTGKAAGKWPSPPARILPEATPARTATLAGMICRSCEV